MALINLPAQQITVALPPVALSTKKFSIQVIKGKVSIMTGTNTDPSAEGHWLKKGQSIIVSEEIGVEVSPANNEPAIVSVMQVE